MRGAAGQRLFDELTGSPEPVDRLSSGLQPVEMAHCPHCEYEASDFEDLSYEGEARALGDSGEAFVAMMVCPGCDAILGFATGGGLA